MKNIYKFELLENTQRSIRCPQFETVVEQIEITEGNPPHEILKHIQECPDCNDYFNFWRGLEQVVHWHTPTKEKEMLSEWEKQQSIHKIQQAIRKKQQQRKMLLWSALSVAVSLLFLILAVFYFIPATQTPSVQAIEQPSAIEHPSTGYSGSSIPYDTTPKNKIPNKDM